MQIEKLRIAFHTYYYFRFITKDNLCPLSHSLQNLNLIILELYKGLERTALLLYTLLLFTYPFVFTLNALFVLSVYGEFHHKITLYFYNFNKKTTTIYIKQTCFIPKSFTTPIISKTPVRFASQGREDGHCPIVILSDMDLSYFQIHLLVLRLKQD